MYETLIGRCNRAIEIAKTIEYCVIKKSTGEKFKYGDNAYMDMCIENCIFVDRNPDIVKNPNDFYGFNRSEWELMV